MRSVFGNPDAVAREIQGQFRQGTDKIVSASLFGPVCKVIWPHKTAFHLAEIADTTERVAARWLSGEHDPPLCVATVMFQKIFERSKSSAE